MRYYEIINERQLTEAELNEAFLNDLAKKLGGNLAAKAGEHITTVSDFTTGLKVIGKAVSNQKYLNVSILEIKKAILSKIKSLKNIPRFKEMNNLIRQHWPKGTTIKDFFKSLLIVCGLNSLLAITSKISNKSGIIKAGVNQAVDTLKDNVKSMLEPVIDKLIDNYANIETLVQSLISSGVSYLSAILKAMGVANAVLFKTLAGVNAKISAMPGGLSEQFNI